MEKGFAGRVVGEPSRATPSPRAHLCWWSLSRFLSCSRAIARSLRWRSDIRLDTLRVGTRSERLKVKKEVLDQCKLEEAVRANRLRMERRQQRVEGVWRDVKGGMK